MNPEMVVVSLQQFFAAGANGPDASGASAIAQQGATHLDMGRYDEALADFNRAIELDNHISFIMASRGKTYLSMGRYDEALADLDYAAQFGDDAFSIGSRANTYLLMGRYDEARADLDRLLERQPDDWLFYKRALTHLAQGQTILAEDDLQQAIALAEATRLWLPPNDDSVFNLPLYYVAANDGASAERFYRSTISGSRNAWLESARLDLNDFWASSQTTHWHRPCVSCCWMPSCSSANVLKLPQFGAGHRLGRERSC